MFIMVIKILDKELKNGFDALKIIGYIIVYSIGIFLLVKVLIFCINFPLNLIGYEIAGYSTINELSLLNQYLYFWGFFLLVGICSLISKRWAIYIALIVGVLIMLIIGGK